MRSFVLVTLTTLIPILAFAQEERWVYRYSGVVTGWRNDEAKSVVYGTDGNIYAAGNSWYNGTEDDFTVISLTGLGSENWVYTYNGLAEYGDAALSVVCGEDGNVYVGGVSTGADTTQDFTVISLSPADTERWVYQYNGPGNASDCVNEVIYGTDDNIYAVGYSWGQGTNYDILVISLTNTGVERWVYRYNGPGNYTDYGRSIVYGFDGNIYVAGETYGVTSFDDFTVISLTSTGKERWVYRYNGQGNWADYAYSVVYGPDSNIYAIGTTYGSTFDPTVVCLDSSGAEQWIYRPPEIGPDGGSAGIYGADGNIYVAGAFGDDITEFMVASLTDSGTRRWEYIYYTPVNSGLEGAYLFCFSTCGTHWLKISRHS